jgi:hypothetical protein
MSSQCFSECFFQEGLLFLKKKKIVLASGRECHTKGWKRDQKGPKKKISIFFHCTCPSAVNSLHIWTCSARALVHGVTDSDQLQRVVYHWFQDQVSDSSNTRDVHTWWFVDTRSGTAKSWGHGSSKVCFVSDWMTLNSGPPKPTTPVQSVQDILSWLTFSACPPDDVSSCHPTTKTVNCLCPFSLCNANVASGPPCRSYRRHAAPTWDCNMRVDLETNTLYPEPWSGRRTDGQRTDWKK